MANEKEIEREKEIEEYARMHGYLMTAGAPEIHRTVYAAATTGFKCGAEWADKNPAFMNKATLTIEKTSLWISIEDDLPAKHTPVYAKNGDKGKVFFALRTDNIARPWYDIVGRCPTTITHWKSIPLK